MYNISDDGVWYRTSAVIILPPHSDTDTTSYKDKDSLSLSLFILVFNTLIVQYLHHHHNLAQGEQEGDNQPGRVLLLGLRLHVEDDGCEAADTYPWVSIRLH